MLQRWDKLHGKKYAFYREIPPYTPYLLSYRQPDKKNVPNDTRTQRIDITTGVGLLQLPLNYHCAQSPQLEPVVSSLLPVSAVLDELLVALRTAPQVLLNAPTGAGKSTWLPLQLLQKGNFPGRIIMLEPRRLAARNVAQRLAQQLGEEPGQTVGYRMRDQRKTGPHTRLEVVTEGILTRMLQRDPELTGVSLVILDEFHERSLQADVALALLLDVQSALRDDLTLLIMSATLDNSRLSQLLPQAPVISSAGRSFPVERIYHPLPSHERFEDAVSSAVLQLLKQQPGSLLLFLPGVAEIQRVQERLATRIEKDTDLCPLYGALPLPMQQQAIQPATAGRRKVVMATNIAETSLTIEGIRLVVDSGLERVARFEVKSEWTQLTTQRISQASMVQRAGRAGRLEPGICWHLFTKEQAERAAEYSSPEVMQSDLSGLWLDLLQWGCQQVTQLSWLDVPPAPALAVAQQRLQQLNAIDAQGKLTAQGQAMARLGCEPRLAAMLTVAAKQSADALATAALLTAIVEEPPRNRNIDLAYWLSRNEPHWQRRAVQLSRRCGDGKGRIDHTLAPGLLSVAFADRLAQQRGQDGRYRLANGIGATMAADDALALTPWLLAVGLLRTEKASFSAAAGGQGDARIVLALPVDINAIIKQSPQWVSEQTVTEWDHDKGTLRAWQSRQWGNLTLKMTPLAKPSLQIRQQALLAWIRHQGLDALNWDERAQQLRTRIQCAQQWLPEESWPPVDDETLLASLESWLLPRLPEGGDLRSLRQMEVAPALLTLLEWPQRQRLESVLPTHYRVPTGRSLPIHYFSDRPPVLAVRLQEMFGEHKSPTLAQGRVVVLLELLSPAQRPLQITADLAAFWQGAYREVQKEMKGRYPKHLWPDDPANTLPTSNTKKHSGGH